MKHGYYAYRHHGCRCDECRRVYSERRASWRSNEPKRRRVRPDVSNVSLPDDGIIDEVAVERLLNGTLPYTAATYAERLEAGRIALRREGGHVICQELLRLRSEAIRRLREEVTA